MNPAPDIRAANSGVTSGLRKAHDDAGAWRAVHPLWFAGTQALVQDRLIKAGEAARMASEHLPVVRLALLVRLSRKAGDGELGLDERGQGRTL